jgi:hypothetical protein
LLDASSTSVDPQWPGWISRAATFTNTAMTSLAIEPKLWAAWYEESYE